ncbi:MAG: zf-HC2 domain-containing protein [Omnitrophica WOR_2 bacterium]
MKLFHPNRVQNHVSDGDLRAYIDRQVSAGDQERIRAHITSCPQCQRQAEVISSRAAQTNRRMESLSSTALLTPSGTARAHLSRYFEQKENSSMSNIFTGILNSTRRYRLAWIAFGLVLILGVSLAFPPVQAIANSFLGLFRVKQFTIVQVSPAQLPEQLGNSAKLEAMFSKDVQFNKHGEPQTVNSAAEAAQTASFAVRLPAQVSGSPKLVIQPGASVSAKVDLPQVRAILNEIGRSDIQLPDSLNGATISVEVPKSVVATYGDCQVDVGKGSPQGFDPGSHALAGMLGNCTTLVQIPSPTLSAPEGLDVQQIGAAYLEVLGMSKTDAEHFAQRIDWSSTLVIPIPQNMATYSDVTVDGVQGTLIRQERSGAGPAQYMLIWVKNGVIYALSGPGPNSEAVSIADSLK